MPRNVVVDSSSLCALERVGLIQFLEKIPFTIIIPPAVQHEILRGKTSTLPGYLHPQALRGKTLKRGKNLELLGIGTGEAQCCALAASLKLTFIVCDDQKFLRQKIFSNDRQIKEMILFGFSFFLHEFYKSKLVEGVWISFDRILKVNNWEHRYVEAANYAFLKEMGH